MTPNPDAVPSDGPLSNPDLVPVPPGSRTWTRWDIAALWVGMAVCIPTYMMASNLIGVGMNWWQAVLTIFLGNSIVLIPMALNAHPGTAYGIPFPVLLRSSFGTRGAKLAAVMRGLVACGWFGIQTWLGGAAIYGTCALLFGFDPATRSLLPGLGISAGELSCFLVFWAINVFFIIKGMDSIRWQGHPGRLGPVHPRQPLQLRLVRGLRSGLRIVSGAAFGAEKQVMSCE